MFVVWGLPYALGSLYDFLRGEWFASWITLGELLPNWLPPLWFGIGIITFLVVTFEGAYRIVQKERNKGQADDDTVTSFARLMREAENLSIINANIRTDDLKPIFEETVAWAIKAVTEISKREGVVADQNIRIKAELPLCGEIHYSDFTVPILT